MNGKLAKTKYGSFLGKRQRKTFVWRGIPYSKSPIGKLRFSPAQPLDEGNHIFHAFKYGFICPQPRRQKRSMRENCLTLNIWAPVHASGKTPVLVYIHGGSFVRGTGNESRYRGKKLCQREDIIVVTINYRLGALGFMDFSFLGNEFSQNCGLSDIALALKFVHETIEAFGGDPDNITAVGQSAGASALSVLIAQQETKEYISKAIMMSGGPVFMHTPDNAQRIAKEFLSFMGIHTAEELKNIPAGMLTKKQNKFIATQKEGEATFSIVIDGTHIREFPLPAAAAGKANEIPVLIGTTKEELSFSDRKLFSKIMMVKDVALAIFHKETREMRGRIIAAYEKYGVRGRAMFISDHIFRMSGLWHAQALSKYAPVWTYSFDYETLLMHILNLQPWHSSDIPYLFGNFGAARCAFMFIFSPIQIRIRRISREMQQDFATFMRTGTLSWPQCTPESAPAKHYNRKTYIAPLVEPEVAAEYEKSEFKRSCFSGLTPTSN